ncbi:hypothetical protein GF322_00640 [Candidatus Dependentiae bacterium]|nr:hypothetical protein [Candidatus Dependentiae bacterium]
MNFKDWLNKIRRNLSDCDTCENCGENVYSCQCNNTEENEDINTDCNDFEKNDQG